MTTVPGSADDDGREQRVQAALDDLLGWSSDFEAGRLSDPAIGADAGERFAVRIPESAMVGVLVGKDKLDVKTTYAKGDAVVTDRRVLIVGAGDEVRHEWVWSRDLGEGSLARGGQGVLWLPSEQMHAAGARHLLGLLTQLAMKRFRGPDERLTAALLPAWERVLGAQQSADLDTWRSGLRTRAANLLPS